MTNPRNTSTLPAVRLASGSGSTDKLGAASLSEVEAFLRRYVFFPPEYVDAEVTILSLWIAHTWAFSAAEATPYMLVTAPTPEAGKSRLMDVVRCLCPEPNVVSDPTAAALFTLIDSTPRITLFIDEADVLIKTPAIKAVLNSGYKIGTPVSRASGTFNVFCPKMLAGISGARSPVTEATLSRCIEIPMVRKKPSEFVEDFSQRLAQDDTLTLRAALPTWADQAVVYLATARPVMPGLSNRSAEVLQPLVAIADIVGGGWSERARESALVLTQRVVRQPDEGTQILTDIKSVWEAIDGDRAHTQMLVAMRNALPDPAYVGMLTEPDLTRRLKSFGIYPESNAFRQYGKHLRGYRRQSFTDAFERYVR